MFVILSVPGKCHCRSLSGGIRAYPELFAAIGPKVPDLRGQFLRGIRDGYTLGQKVGNTLGRHNHTQPAHTHSFSGQLASTALSGTAAGQKYLDGYTGFGMYPGTPVEGIGSAQYVTDVTFNGENGNVNVHTAWMKGDSMTRTANSSSVTGRLDNGRVNGSIGSGGGDPTDYTGGAETAPDHLYVRYLIRARQMPLP